MIAFEWSEVMNFKYSVKFLGVKTTIYAQLAL